ncbi:MAG: hypothetical protein RLZZ387_2781 [Chloroflexota bacterium]
MKTTLNPTLAPPRVDAFAQGRVLQLLVLLTGLVAHSVNMFGFPLFLGDEGIVMQNAWAVLRMGFLTPYTYWYDNPPAGWILVAAWTALTGGFQTFGTAVDGGRVLMLVLHGLSIVLVFRITLGLSGSSWAAAAAALLFTLSPLSVIYGRMVLLDNIMVFWLLLSTLLLVRYEGQFWTLMTSAICFALAVLTKEIAAVFLPAYFIAIYTLLDRQHARFARTGWLYVALATISLYALFASLKDELFNAQLSSPLADSRGEVTLAGALAWQLAQRGGAPWDPTSDFQTLLTGRWLGLDPWLLGLGAMTALLGIARGPAPRRIVGLMGLLSIAALAYGGPVLEHNVLIALPWLAIAAGLLVSDIGRGGMGFAAPLLAIGAVSLSGLSLYQHREIYSLDVTSGQREALAWIREHVPAGSNVITDDDIWVDLREGSAAAPAFPKAHSHWKAAYDPAIWIDVFDDNWRKVDYMVLTPGMERIFAANPDRLTAEAFAQSTEIARFGAGDAAVTVRRVNYPGESLSSAMNQTWGGFKQRFISEGQVRVADEPALGRHQAAAMLMAVWMDDRATFDQVWGYTKKHMLDRRGLLVGKSGDAADSRTGLTEADTDAAMALVMAANRWQEPTFRTDAKRIVRAIRQSYIVKVDGRPILAAGDWAISRDQVIFAPASFSPAAYHLFADVDPLGDWWYTLDTSYNMLSRASRARLGETRSAGLPPAYVGVDRETGALLENPRGAPTTGNTFDVYAAEVYWRLALDARLHDDGRAERLLTASTFLADDWRRSGSLASAYTHRGTREGREESLAFYSAVLPKIAAQSQPDADAIYTTKIATQYRQTRDTAVWGTEESIDTFRLAWLANALYGQELNDDWSNLAPKPMAVVSGGN